MQNHFVPTHVYNIHAPLLLLLPSCVEKYNVVYSHYIKIHFFLFLKKTFLKKVERLCSLGDGYWLPWGTWSACSVSCGVGHRKRTRICVPPRLVERHAMEVMSLVLKNSMPCVTKHYFVQVWI